MHAVHVAAVRSPEAEQLDTPDTSYPSLHVGWHVDPSWSVLLQLPTPPFAGAALALHGAIVGVAVGAAVGGFSESLDAAASLEGLKSSIGSVTGGLGVAFDTTLLALVLSVVS